MTPCDPPLTNPDTSTAPTDGSPERNLDLPDGVPALRAFYLYLSTSCNLACRHCWITPRFVNGKPDPGDVIDVDDLRAAVREARTLGLARCKLTGGEPMLHPRFLEIVDMLSAEGLGLDMETNGTLLTPELARHLKENTKLSFISVSLDGPDAASHDSFRNVPGSFDSALGGLRSLVSAGYENVQVIMSVWRGNRERTREVVQLALDQGAGSVKFNVVTASGRGSDMHERGEALSFEEHLAFARYVREELRPAFSAEATRHFDLILSIPPALQPISELWRTRGRVGDCGVQGILGVLGSGEFALCGIGRTIPELVYGRLGQDSVRDIWLTHPVIAGLRRTLDDIESYPGICADCVHAHGCRTGCVAVNYNHSGRLVWPNWLCEEAEQRGSFPASRVKSTNRNLP
jgi:SynChlorMet cassette radical SAM/SPASM protein ScmF